MRFVDRRIPWLPLILACWLTVPAPDASSEEAMVSEMLLSLVHPAPVIHHEERLGSNIRELLSVPLRRSPVPLEHLPRVFSEETLRSAFGGAGQRFEGTAPSAADGTLLPGTTLPRMMGHLPHVPCRSAFLALSSRAAGDLMDMDGMLHSSGRMAADPTLIYSRLEIHVNRSTYELNLYAFRGNERRTLYSTKVGLGSREFPTPRGTYYVARIYDDNPIWIPPQDRWWAWGQRPSRSVYGGHMMPFFSKRTIRGSTPFNSGTDMIAPKVKMIDYGMYRIHGTNSPWSVGSNQSHGCVRMLNKTVKALADNLKMYAGTTNRGESANGPYVNLARPVKLILE